jgi:flagellar biosynthesis protein FlhF
MRRRAEVMHYSRTVPTGSTRKRVPARATEMVVNSPGEVLRCGHANKLRTPGRFANNLERCRILRGRIDRGQRLTRPVSGGKMQIKEFEGVTLKECLEQVRESMGPDAVILETRKLRKGGVMGMGAHDAIAVVAATGITVQSDHADLIARPPSAAGGDPRPAPSRSIEPPLPAATARASAVPRGVASGRAGTVPAVSPAALAARGVYGATAAARADRAGVVPRAAAQEGADAYAALLETSDKAADVSRRLGARIRAAAPPQVAEATPAARAQTDRAPAERANATDEPPRASAQPPTEAVRFAHLERAIGEIRECLVALQREQREAGDRTLSAVVSAVAPAVTAAGAARLAAYADDLQPRFPDLQDRMSRMGLADALIQELFDQLPDLGAWSEAAREALAESAIKDLLTRRLVTSGPIELTPGRAKVVALIGPTGVGKTTTIAKLAADFALLQGKRVALLTVDTYRIAAVEQLKTYSEIIGLPIGVAYGHAEVPAIISRYADYDLVLIDTAGRSQQHNLQIGELKSLLDTVDCESHLVLAAPTKEADMLDAARRFSAARVDRLIFSKLDETASYGTLLNVADKTGTPVSYVTTGQKVPEDLEAAESSKLAGLIFD